MKIHFLVDIYVAWASLDTAVLQEDGVPWLERINKIPRPSKSGCASYGNHEDGGKLTRSRQDQSGS